MNRNARGSQVGLLSEGRTQASQVQVGFKRTGRACAAPGCGGRLRDSTLDWEDALPEAELKASEAAADAAGLALCLGTSLLVRPACNLPLRTVRKGA